MDSGSASSRRWDSCERREACGAAAVLFPESARYPLRPGVFCGAKLVKGIGYEKERV